MKKAMKIAGIVVGAIVLLAIIYVAYVFISYNRIEDNQVLEIEQTGVEEKEAPVEKQLRITSYNIGFGAYSDDYSFFMDGGTESRAFSKEAVYENVGGAVEAINAEMPDIALFQEVDTDGTRSYHIDERQIIKENIVAKVNQSVVYAQNYDSPYLLYPLTSPHGANKAGVMTFSGYEISSATRISLPIETGFSKVLDLDRCYSKSTISTENGKELVIYNMHLSAYTANAETAENQLLMVIEDMQEEYNKGNYCIAGGDFNRDLLGNSPEIFHTAVLEDNWAQPVNKDLFTDDITLVAPFDETDPKPSCRNANKAYEEGDFVVTVDGFIISANVELIKSDVIDTGFEYSDHNPVYMDFKLLK